MNKFLKQYLMEIKNTNIDLDPRELYNEGRYMLAKSYRDLKDIPDFKLTKKFFPTFQHVLPWSVAVYRNNFNLKKFKNFPNYQDLNEYEANAITILSYSMSEPYERIFCNQNLHVYEASMIINTLHSRVKEFLLSQNKIVNLNAKPSNMNSKVPKNKDELYPSDLPADANIYHMALRVFWNLDKENVPE